MPTDGRDPSEVRRTMIHRALLLVTAVAAAFGALEVASRPHTARPLPRALLAVAYFAAAVLVRVLSTRATRWVLGGIVLVAMAVITVMRVQEGGGPQTFAIVGVVPLLVSAMLP